MCSFTPDEKTAEYCNVELTDELKDLKGDADAVYAREITYNAEDLVPVLACPSQVDNIKPVTELAGTAVDQVFIGSCTNGRLEDLQCAAAILKGKKVAPFVKLIVTPQAARYIKKLLQTEHLRHLLKPEQLLHIQDADYAVDEQAEFLLTER